MINIFILLVVFQIKHFIADYPLQNEYMLGKFKDGWDFFRPLFIHCLVHFIITECIVWIYTNDIVLSFKLALFNGTIHFFMDRIKAGKKYMGRWKPLTAEQWIEAKKLSVLDLKFSDDFEVINAKKKLRSNKLFWWSIGFDQLIHHLTDIACIYIMVR